MESITIQRSPPAGAFMGQPPSLCKQNTLSPFVLHLPLLLIITATAIQIVAGNGTSRSHFIGSIGVLLDHSTFRKEVKTAIEIALDDFHRSTGHRVLLHIRDSNDNPLQVASTVVGLIEQQQVRAILGSLTWQEAAMFADASEKTKDVPIISLVANFFTYPNLSYQRDPVIQMATDMSEQFDCIAAIIGSYGWRRVIVIYEDGAYTDSSRVVNLLSDSLQGVGSEVEHRSALPHFNSLRDPKAVIREELTKLKTRQCKVFILARLSMPMAMQLFIEARQLGMMSEGYVWIVGDDVGSRLDSVGSSILSSSMQGVIGIKTHFLETADSFRDFSVRYQRRFKLENPEKVKSEPGLYALHAYDAAHAIASAMINISINGGTRFKMKLFEAILTSNFTGLSGKIELNNGKLATRPTFRIINVVGKSYREVGLWSKRIGFYENEVDGFVGNGGSGDHKRTKMDDLGPIFWPGGARRVPRGWVAAVAGPDTKALWIAVPARGAFNQFVKVGNDSEADRRLVSGFSVEVFEAVVRRLPYHLPYELIPYEGSYDEMVQQIHVKTFDAAVGDIEIIAERCRYAEFSQPYMDAGLVMVVTERNDNSKKAWTFMEPFTMSMWVLTAASCVFTGFVVSMIERGARNEEFGGDVGRQSGTLLWFGFSTFFFTQREPLKSNLSRLVLLTWLFVALILNSSFTASLTSMLTVSRLKPSVVDINFLKQSAAMVGCNDNSFIVQYLVEVVGFSPTSIMRIASIQDYPEALLTRKIAAAFFVEPHAKVFLSQYCQGFTIAGPTYKLGGFGFVFPKGSPLAIDFSEAILEVVENGEIQNLEKALLSSTKCSSAKGNDQSRLGPDAFQGLFLISGGVSTAALLFSLITRVVKNWQLGTYIYTVLIKRRILGWALCLLGGKLLKPHRQVPEEG